jgi:putative ABC transport system permease protein
MRDQPLGANINQTLVLDGPVSVSDSLYMESYTSFKNGLLEINGVKNVTASASIMGKEIYMTNGAKLASSHSNEWYTFYMIYADYDFIPAFGMDMKAGRFFLKDFPTDKKGVILNEQAVRLFGLSSARAALRESIIYDNDSLKILGVVSDFHQQGLHVAINPIIFVLRPEAHNYYSIKFNTTNIRQTTASVERIWDRYYPSDPFSYFFLDDAFDHQYKADLQFGKVFGLFAFLAIGIACFGLLSLSAYNVIQRTKEIGIRKVLGASAGNIVSLLSTEFFVLVLLGILIATPVAWYVMKGWLQGFAYRIPIHWWVFMVAGSLAILIALLAVSYHAIRAALANPVTSLRTE